MSWTDPEGVLLAFYSGQAGFALALFRLAGGSRAIILRAHSSSHSHCLAQVWTAWEVRIGEGVAALFKRVEVAGRAADAERIADENRRGESRAQARLPAYSNDHVLVKDMREARLDSLAPVECAVWKREFLESLFGSVDLKLPSGLLAGEIECLQFAVERARIDRSMSSGHRGEDGHSGIEDEKQFSSLRVDRFHASGTVFINSLVDPAGWNRLTRRQLEKHMIIRSPVSEIWAEPNLRETESDQVAPALGHSRVPGAWMLQRR